MNTTKFRELSSLLIIIVFLGFIFGIAALSLYKAEPGRTYTYFENRNLAEFPAAETETLLDGSFFSAAENWYRDHTAGRECILACHTILNMDILKRPVVNEVVIADGVLLPHNAPETVDREKINALAKTVGERLSSHSDVCASYGGKFYYVAVPCQYVYFEDKYPQHTNSRREYTAAASSALFAELDKKGVSYIDMLKVFDEKGRPAEYYSTVDNHYTVLGALETYSTLMEKINEDTGADLRIMTGDDYTVTELPNPYMGSRTRKLFGLRPSGETLSVVTPNEDVPFTRWDYGNETPSASTVFSLPANETDEVLYKVFMGGDCSVTKIETDRPELPSILIYGDSFTNALESVIWYNFDTMYSLDLRYYSDMTLDDFISEYEPDVVVCLRDYEQLVNPLGNGQ